MFEFLTVTAIGLLAIISPGPDFAIVTKTSLVEGRKAGFGSALGIAIGNLCHVAINLFGIGLVIAESAVAFTVLKILGAMYLIYIGFKGIRSKPAVEAAEVNTSLITPMETLQGSEIEMELDSNASAACIESSPSLIKTPFMHGAKLGFLTCILNPKAGLFFLSFFSVILSAQTTLITQIIYGAWISLMAWVWFLLIALFFTHPVISLKLKASKHWIERITGGALMLLGLRLLTAKVAS